MNLLSNLMFNISSTGYSSLFTNQDIVQKSLLSNLKTRAVGGLRFSSGVFNRVGLENWKGFTKLSLLLQGLGLQVASQADVRDLKRRKTIRGNISNITENRLLRGHSRLFSAKFVTGAFVRQNGSLEQVDQLIPVFSSKTYNLQLS